MSTVVDKLKEWVTGGPDTPEEVDFDTTEMSIVEHLEELRSRMVISVLALVVGTAIGLLFSNQIFAALYRPAPVGFKPVAIEMTEMFTTYFKVGIFTGVALAMPVFVYQIFRFIGPGLTRKEQRLILTLLPLVSFFFMVGIAFGYLVVLPFAISYLLTFSTVATPEIRIGNYVSFVLKVMLWMGLAFETPLIIFMLAKVRIVNVRRLASYRKYALLAVFVIAAIITPTPDPFNQTLVAVPLYMLYELGVLFARFA